MTPQYVTPPDQLGRTPPDQLGRALRDLLRGRQEAVFADPTATDDYRALTQQAVLGADAALKDGATPYEAVIFALAPESAAAVEATVEAAVRPDDGAGAATARRANAPVYLEVGDTPGSTPETPPERRDEARAALGLLLTGWERAVREADVSDHHRRIVAETVTRVREALEHHTSAHNLVATLLAPAFLLPDETDLTGMTTADLEALRAVLH